MLDCDCAMDVTQSDGSSVLPHLPTAHLAPLQDPAPGNQPTTCMRLSSQVPAERNSQGLTSGDSETHGGASITLSNAHVAPSHCGITAGQGCLELHVIEWLTGTACWTLRKPAGKGTAGDWGLQVLLAKGGPFLCLEVITEAREYLSPSNSILH